MEEIIYHEITAHCIKSDLLSWLIAYVISYIVALIIVLLTIKLVSCIY